LLNDFQSKNLNRVPALTSGQFFDMGNDSLLAFFEIPKGEEPGGNRNAIGAMQHCAFVVTAERFSRLRAECLKLVSRFVRREQE